jgi:Na+-transporting NADH:ubiquinone oxidoreductase subunit C
VKKGIFSVGYMFLITLCFTSLVSAVKVLNDEKIHRNEDLKLQKIILKVLAIPVSEKISDQDVVALFLKRVKTTEAGGKTVYIGKEEEGEAIKGFAFPIGGAGFWGPISGVVAVNPDASEIIGIAFYRHSETPGLGGRVTEDWFTSQFVGIPVYAIEDNKKIFSLKPAGTGEAPNELDAITGATGTSRGVEAFVNQELDHFLREIWGSVKKG